MKRHGNLWQHVLSFESLLRAAEQACKGKRFRPTVASFHFNLEHELWTLHEELSTKIYRPRSLAALILPIADAIQVPVRAQQQLTIADCYRGIGPAFIIIEHVVRQQFKLRPGRHHVHAIVLRDKIEFAIGQNRGRVD